MPHGPGPYTRRPLARLDPDHNVDVLSFLFVLVCWLGESDPGALSTGHGQSLRGRREEAAAPTPPPPPDTKINVPEATGVSHESFARSWEAPWDPQLKTVLERPRLDTSRLQVETRGKAKTVWAESKSPRGSEEKVHPPDKPPTPTATHPLLGRCLTREENAGDIAVKA